VRGRSRRLPRRLDTPEYSVHDQATCKVYREVGRLLIQWKLVCLPQLEHSDKANRFHRLANVANLSQEILVVNSFAFQTTKR
jgi:hypothetical protein